MMIHLLKYLTRCLLSISLVFSALCCGQYGKDTEFECQTFYIDPVAGNDANNGRSEEKAWKTFINVKGSELGPGDSLLLRADMIYREQLCITDASGGENRPIVIGSYGEGNKPSVIGQDKDECAVLILNCSDIIVENLDISNKKVKGLSDERISGITVRLDNYDTAKNTVLRNLLVHDVNGVMDKQKSGSGINLDNRGEKPGIFDGILIEDCIVRNCSRNGIVVNNKNYERQNWNPHRGVIVRRNLLEGVPGDGILTIGCDGALVEYNIMRDCPDFWENSTREAAAGIWPWSSDNTIIQFNEVSGQKAPWDGQAFDSDYNCTNTTIRYNYSHDNYGGFLLICDYGDERGTYSVGNNNVRIYGNISCNDGIRPYTTPRTNSWFAPVIHISGPVSDTSIKHNIIHCSRRKNPLMDHTVIECTSWGGFPDLVEIAENVIYSEDVQYDIVLSKAHEVSISNNYGSSYPGYEKFLKTVQLPIGEITVVDSTMIENYFNAE